SWGQESIEIRGDRNRSRSRQESIEESRSRRSLHRKGSNSFHQQLAINAPAVCGCYRAMLSPAMSRRHCRVRRGNLLLITLAATTRSAIKQTHELEANP